MIAQGFAPDVVSSDVHLFCVDGPAFDLLVCLSKLLNLGMDLVEIVRSATQTPAEVIGRTDLGSLTPGAAGDAAVLRLVQGRFPYVDATGKTLTGDRHLVSAGIVMGGQWIPNEGADAMPALEHFHPHPVNSHADAVARRFHTRHPVR
jgi:dihydroorotase